MDKFAAIISGYLGIDSIFDFICVFLDVAIIAFLIYKVIVIFKDTRAFSLLKSIIFIFIASYVAKLLNLSAVSTVLGIILNVMPVLAIVLFAPEIRKLLENLGKKKITDLIKTVLSTNGNSASDKERKEIKRIVDETVEAVVYMSKVKTGAIIVFQVNDDVSDWDRQGTIIDARVSTRLLEQIFIINTPLHDAAVIISKGRLHAAQCVLPLTENNNVDLELGTRHRAAIGASENADCIVVVVSEETGIISLAKGGELMRGLTGDILRTHILSTLLPDEIKKPKKQKKHINKVKGLNDEE